MNKPKPGIPLKRKEVIYRLEHMMAELQYGSIEIYIQDGQVVQLTSRKIDKINEI